MGNVCHLFCLIIMPGCFVFIGGAAPTLPPPPPGRASTTRERVGVGPPTLAFVHFSSHPLTERPQLTILVRLMDYMVL